MRLLIGFACFVAAIGLDLSPFLASVGASAEPIGGNPAGCECQCQNGDGVVQDLHDFGDLQAQFCAQQVGQSCKYTDKANVVHTGVYGACGPRGSLSRPAGASRGATAVGPITGNPQGVRAPGDRKPLPGTRH